MRNTLLILAVAALALTSCGSLEYTDSSGAPAPLLPTAPIKLTFQNPFELNGAAVLPPLPSAPPLAPAPAALSAPSGKP